MMPNLWQTRQSFWLHSSFLALERHQENLNFQRFYTTKTNFDGDFQWELCTNFQKKCSWGRYKSLQFFGSEPPVLLSERVFYLLKRLGGGCFQWDGCVHFQMIWSGTSCINSKFPRDTRRFWSHSSVFALEKYSKNLSLKSIFTTETTLVATFSETRGPISKEYVVSQG